MRQEIRLLRRKSRRIDAADHSVLAMENAHGSGTDEDKSRDIPGRIETTRESENVHVAHGNDVPGEISSHALAAWRKRIL